MRPPAPLQMSSYMGACSCGTFFKDEDYADDLVANRKETRLFQAWFDNQISKALLQEILPTQQVQQPGFIQNIAQRVVQLLPQPIQNLLSRFISNIQLPFTVLTQFAAKTGAALENVMSKIATFFFGNKKDRTLEKEQREQDDIATTDLFDAFFLKKESLKSNNDGSEGRQ